MSERSPAVRLEGLTVEVPGLTLLHGADLTIAHGEVVLLAGPSGSGKSVLLRLIGGLLSRRAGFGLAGSLEVLGHDVVANPAASRGEVGLVSQEFALFTGHTTAENVTFALDHRRPRLDREETERARRALLDELGLSGESMVGTLSGGQRQRVAIARALAYEPRLLAYDEPTSGLDPAMRDVVAKRIGETSREHGATTLIVTHDLSGLLPIADRVVLLDPKDGKLVEVAPEEAPDRLAELRAKTRPGEPRPSMLRRAARSVAGFLEGSSRATEGLAIALWHLVPRWPSGRWGLRFLLHYLKAVAGPGAMLYFLLAGAVIGLVSTYFVFTFLPSPQYTEPLILDDLVGGLGFALHRILVPLIMTLMLAARAGAAVSADISTRVAGRQTEAMKTLGAPPSRYLLTGVVWAFLLGMPVLAFLSFLGARLASAGVFAVLEPDRSLFEWSEMFSRLIDEEGSFLPKGWGWVAAKDLCASFGIAAIAYFTGAKDKDSPEDVARAITNTVIGATVLVLSIHVVFAFFEF